MMDSRRTILSDATGVPTMSAGRGVQPRDRSANGTFATMTARPELKIGS
jgi:hypothetical protein